MPRKKYSEAREATRFAVILFVLMAVFGGLSLWRGHTTRAAVFAGIGTFALLVGLLLRPLWLRVFRLWMKLAVAMSFVMTRVLLTLFFYLIITPFGVVRRLLGKDSLNARWHDGKPTYWVDKPEGEFTVERYEKQY
jgi:hypothetical protein